MTTFLATFLSVPFRRTLTILLLLLMAQVDVTAQLGVKVTQLRPTGEFGEVMERKVSAQLMYIDGFDEMMRTRFFVTYYKMEPRLETFPIVGYGYSDGIWTVYPGEQTFTKYDLLIFGGGLDLGVLQLLDDKLTFYPGFEIFGGALNQAYTSNVPGISSEDFEGGFLIAGISVRAGADYALSDVVATFAEWTTGTYYVQETGRFTYNEIGLGVRITF